MNEEYERAAKRRRQAIMTKKSRATVRAAAAEMLWQVGASDEAGFELEIKPTFFYRAASSHIVRFVTTS